MKSFALRTSTATFAVFAFACAGFVGATAEPAVAATASASAAHCSGIALVTDATQQFELTKGLVKLPNGPSQIDYEMATGTVVAKDMDRDKAHLVVNMTAKTGDNITLAIDVDTSDSGEQRAVVDAKVDGSPVGVFSCVASYSADGLLMAKSFDSEGGLTAAMYLTW